MERVPSSFLISFQIKIFFENPSTNGWDLACDTHTDTQTHRRTESATGTPSLLDFCDHRLAPLRYTPRNEVSCHFTRYANNVRYWSSAYTNISTNQITAKSIKKWWNLAKSKVLVSYLID